MSAGAESAANHLRTSIATELKALPDHRGLVNICRGRTRREYVAQHSTKIRIRFLSGTAAWIV